MSILGTANVALSAAGYGYCTITVTSGVKWTVESMSVSTKVNDPTGLLVQPVVRVYRDSSPNMSHFLEGTYSGNGANSDTKRTLRGGDCLTAEWILPDPSVASKYAGVIATFIVEGEVEGARAF